MLKYILALSLSVLTGCATDGAASGKKLHDYNGSDRAGIAFNVNNGENLYIYPETKDCINIESDQGGYVDRAFFLRKTLLNNKKIGIPTVAGMSAFRREFWLSAKDNIVILDYSNDNFFAKPYSGVSFKPEVGKFYYVTPDYERDLNPNTRNLNLSVIIVYEIIKDTNGVNVKVPVKLKNYDSAYEYIKGPSGLFHETKRKNYDQSSWFCKKK